MSNLEVEILQSGQAVDVDMSTPALSVWVAQVADTADVDLSSPALSVDVFQAGVIADVWLLAGPAGPAGGPVGPQGPTGPTGATGATGPAGAIGATGAAGTNGTNGTNGADGSKWLSGAGAPSGATGVVTDWYLNTTNDDVYEKTGVSTWTLRANIKGSTGATGSIGPTGPTGPAGTNGTNGTGVPTGGTTGQVLKKNSATNFDTGWVSLGTAATVDTGTTSGTIPLLGASGTLAVARLATGTPDGTKFVRDDGTLATPAGGSGGTNLLALTTRTATTASSYAVASSTPNTLDTTNLAVTFTVPASGAVVVRVNGAANISAGTASLRVNLRTASGGSTTTGNVVGTNRTVWVQASGGVANTVPIATTHVVTGLTPAASLTWYLSASGSAASLIYGLGAGANEFSTVQNGAITLEVWG